MCSFPLRDQVKPVDATYRFCDYQNLQLAKWKPPALGYPLFPTREFSGNISWKIIYFPRKDGEGREGTDRGLFDPTASSCFHSGHPRSGQIIIGCLGGSRAAGSVPDPPRLGLWMQIKLFPLYQTPCGENQSQKLQCGAAELSDLMLQSG